MFTTQASIEDFVARHFAADCSCQHGALPSMRPYVQRVEMPAGAAGETVIAPAVRVSGFSLVYWRVDAEAAPPTYTVARVGLRLGNVDASNAPVYYPLAASSQDRYPAILRDGEQLTVSATLAATASAPWAVYLVGVAVNG